jgi:hypothetical protein
MAGTRNCFIIIFLLSLLIFLFYHLIAAEPYGMMPGTLHPKWIMIKSRNCPFCIEQMKELQKKSSIQLKENLQILDKDQDSVATSNLKLNNYKGVPHFQNMKTGETFSGFTSIEDLEKKIGKDSVNQWKDAMQTTQGRDARTFIHRGIKYNWDTNKFPIDNY